MNDERLTEIPVARRHLIRGGSLAAGAAVLGATLNSKTAEAADGDTLRLGRNNESGTTTTITIDGATGGQDAALTLNNANGPSLALEPLDSFDGGLDTGDIVNTQVGPEIGVNYGGGPVTTFLATGVDLANVYPIPVERLLDLEIAASHTAIVNASSRTPLDSKGRLKSSQYIDVRVASTEDVTLIGLFLNVTVSHPVGDGYLEIYTPGTRPIRPSIIFQKSVSLTNSILVGPGINGTQYTVRVYASTTTHLAIDILGAIQGYPPSGVPAATPKVGVQRRLSRQARQREQLIRSIQNT